jgi:TrmH family RNA methyltransferase
MFLEIPEELCREVYLSESFASGPEGRIALEKAGRMGCEVQTVADPVFQYLSDTQSPQGILAVARQLSCRMEDLSGKGQKPLILLLENLQTLLW